MSFNFIKFFNMEVIMDFKEIEKVIDKYIDEIIEFRRDIHAYP